MKFINTDGQIDRYSDRGVTIEIDGTVYPLASGQCDTIIAYDCGDNIAILSYYDSLPCIGLQVFQKGNTEELGSIFEQEQRAYDLLASVGSRWYSEDYIIAHKLLALIDC